MPSHIATNILDGRGLENIGENTHSSPIILTKFGEPFKGRLFLWLMQEYKGV
jgi:hypothetical protein